MRIDRLAAQRLRLRGRSYNEIQRVLGIPKSTLHGWFVKLTLPPAARERISNRIRRGSLLGLIRRNKHQTALARVRATHAREGAARVITSLSRHDLLLIGAALYWAEGYKRVIIRNGQPVTHHPVSFTNSDPMLVKMFLRFLRECLLVSDEKIKADLRIFPHQHGRTVQRYWQSQTGISSKNFSRIYTGISQSSRGKRPFNRLSHGVIQIRVANTPLFHTIMGYIAGLQKFV